MHYEYILDKFIIYNIKLYIKKNTSSSWKFYLIIDSSIFKILTKKSYDSVYLKALLGNIEVFQILFPRVTTTGIEPHPFTFLPSDSFLISADSFFPTYTKCHSPAVPFSLFHFHSLVLILNSFFTHVSYQIDTTPTQAYSYCKLFL